MNQRFGDLLNKHYWQDSKLAILRTVCKSALAGSLNLHVLNLAIVMRFAKPLN